MHDLLIRGASVLDGSGSPRYDADVSVDGDTISAIGKLSGESARRTIDASRLFLAPGFIDIHAHSELEVLRDPAMKAKAGQGITTDISGNCGIGPFPVRGDGSILQSLTRDVLGPATRPYWKDFDAYKEELGKKGSGINMGFLVSHSALRCAAMKGNPNRPATRDEVATMTALMEEAFDQGCFGFSTGLYYAPCAYADRAELAALLRVAAKRGKMFSVHQRQEADDVLSSLDEILSLAKETGVQLEISHLKALGRQNQGKVPAMLEKIEDARRAGVDVAFDQYPYTYGSTSLFSLLPPDILRLPRHELRKMLRDSGVRSRVKEQMVHPRGWDSIYETAGWDGTTILVLESHPEFEMKTIEEIARERDQDGFDAFFDILAGEEGTALMSDVTQSEDSLVRIMRHPLMCFGTDALYAGELCHPRSYSAAVHFLSRYGRELAVMSWEEMIRKMTGEAADRLRLGDRGYVEVGKKADLVLFDPDAIRDTATAREPERRPVGLPYVFVNGQLVVDAGRETGRTAGRILIS